MLHYISIAALIGEAGGDPWAINQSLQEGRPAQIAGLAEAFHAAGRCTAESSRAFDEARRRFEASWNRENGEHPINDSAEVQRVTKALGAQSLQLPKIGADLENIAAALAEAQRIGAALISTLESQLQQLDNEIGQGLELEKNPHLSAAQRAALDEQISGLQQHAIDDTKSALGQLDSLRNGYSDYLRKSSTTLQTDGYDQPLVAQADADTPPPSTDPDDVPKWWKSLTPEEQQRLIAEHPDQIGNLIGVPISARSDANRAVMKQDISRVHDAATRSGVSDTDVVRDPAKYGLTGTDITRYQNALKTSDGLIHDSNHGNYPTYLLSYDPTAFGGKGRTAICIGDPDKAANTSVIVPGTNSSVAGGWLSDRHDDALNLFEQSNKADPAHPTAVIAWMGYDAPVADLNHWDQAITDPSKLQQVGTPWMARQGGELLARDVNGLWVTHDSGIPQHVTVLGHSYGSTTVADAFANSGMHANDAVLLGCPGTDLARNAADFHLNGGHVYVGDASTDPIGWIGESGHLPNWVNDASGHPVGSLAGLGSDPASDQFGSIRFDAEVPGSDGIHGSDHSHYYAMGSESLRAMTDIASGHSDRLGADHLWAAPRHQPHLATPDHVDVPGIARVPIPHVNTPIPGTPTVIDPEWERLPNSIHDNHQY